MRVSEQLAETNHSGVLVRHTAAGGKPRGFEASRARPEAARFRLLIAPEFFPLAELPPTPPSAAAEEQRVPLV